MAAVAHLATSAFADAGIWGAIIGATIALLAAAWAVVAWVRRIKDASDIAGALHAAGLTQQQRPDIAVPEGFLAFEACLLLANGGPVQLYFRVFDFVLSGPDWVQDFAGPVAPGHIPPGHQGKPWVRDSSKAKEGTVVTVRYQVLYGVGRNRPRRVLTASTTMPAVQVKARMQAITRSEDDDRSLTLRERWGLRRYFADPTRPKPLLVPPRTTGETAA
jgi:hypothetical protein